MQDEDGSDRNARFQREALVWLPAVARFARALTKDAADAEDLVQETFLRAYGAWHSFEPGTDCRRWLFTICRHAFLRTRRREQLFVAADDPEAEALASARLAHLAAERGLESAFDRIDLGPALSRSVAALSEIHRRVLLLVDVSDLSYDEAAEILEIPVGTVRSRLFRARRLVQEALLGYAEDAGFQTAASVSAMPGLARGRTT